MLDEEIISLNRMKLFARSSDLSVVTAKDMNIVVNLVEKQQKEIEKLKKQDLRDKIRNRIKCLTEYYEKKSKTRNVSLGRFYSRRIFCRNYNRIKNDII